MPKTSAGRSAAAVVIFARAPQLGRVKTRLVPPLTARLALALHSACLQATAALVASLPPSIHKYLYLTGGTSHGLRVPGGFSVRQQQGRDLGARLKRMFAELFGAGYERVVVIGSDSPTLPRRRLLEALAGLRRRDVVLGPTEDGGYYLLGCRRASSPNNPRKSLPDVFHGIPWGTAKTFARTVERLRSEGIRYRVLLRWYDVDRPADLKRLRRVVMRRRKAFLKPLKDYFRR